jgi:hypothetical protein
MVTASSVLTSQPPPPGNPLTSNARSPLPLSGVFGSHLRIAVRSQEPSTSREGALRYTLLATTYVRQDDPDLDHALALAGHAVDLLTDQVTSTRCVGHLTTLAGDLTPYRRRPAVRELSNRIRSLHTATSTRNS